MTQWFSPGAWRQLGKPLGGRRGGRMEDWFQRTAWWSDNSAWNTPWMTVGETRLQPLRDLVDIVVSRFTGRSLELDLQTHTARFVLHLFPSLASHFSVAHVNIAMIGVFLIGYKFFDRLFCRCPRAHQPVNVGLDELVKIPTPGPEIGSKRII